VEWLDEGLAILLGGMFFQFLYPSRPYPASSPQLSMIPRTRHSLFSTLVLLKRSSAVYGVKHYFRDKMTYAEAAALYPTGPRRRSNGRPGLTERRRLHRSVRGLSHIRAKWHSVRTGPPPPTVSSPPTMSRLSTLAVLFSIINSALDHTHLSLCPSFGSVTH
jgi:hypothetical protein